MNHDKKFFDDKIANLIIQGDTCEYEVLVYQYLILVLLKKGRMIIDW